MIKNSEIQEEHLRSYYHYVKTLNDYITSIYCKQYKESHKVNSYLLIKKIISKLEEIYNQIKINDK